MNEERCLTATGTCATSSRRTSSESAEAKPAVEETYGPFGPIGRCPTIVLPKSNRLVRHRKTFVDDSLFGSARLPQPHQSKKPIERNAPEGEEDTGLVESKGSRRQSQTVSRPLSATAVRSQETRNDARRQSQTSQSLKNAPHNLRPRTRGFSVKPPALACNMLGRPVALPPSNTSLSVNTQSKIAADSVKPPSELQTSQTKPRSSLSAIQKWQTRFRPVRTRSSEVQFGLFAPMKDSLFWSAMEDWYEEDAFAKGKHGMFDTDAVQSVNDTDIIQCLKVNRKNISEK